MTSLLRANVTEQRGERAAALILAEIERLDRVKVTP